MCEETSRSGSKTVPREIIVVILKKETRRPGAKVLCLAVLNEETPKRRKIIAQ